MANCMHHIAELAAMCVHSRVIMATQLSNPHKGDQQWRT